jgi:hypothetical protein
MNIYENYYIGAFIHAAGYQAGFRAVQNPGEVAPPVALGNYQQGPLDSTLSDLLWGRRGKHLLIEFKARFKGIDRERIKRARTLLFKEIGAAGVKSPLRECVDQSHYFAVGGWKSKGSELLRFGPYSLLANSVSELGFYNKSEGTTSFINRLLNGELGADETTFRQYLDLLQKCVDQANNAAAPRGTSGSTGGTKQPKRIADAHPGGLLLSVTETGVVHMVPFDTFEMLVELQMQLAEVAPEPPSKGLGL